MRKRRKEWSHGQRVVVREYGCRIDPEADPRRAPAAGERRRRAMARVLRVNHEWEGSGRTTPGSEYFRQTIAPELPRFTLKALMDVTGLTKSACSRIRSGRVVPHPRHWEGILAAGRGKTASVATEPGIPRDRSLR